MYEDKEYWDHVAETWDATITSKQSPHYHYYHTIDLLISQTLRESDAKKALELGCGTAQCAINVIKMLSTANVHITGIDISPKMIELGQQNVKNAELKEKITLDVGDVTQLPYPDAKFDVVFSRGAPLSYTNDPMQMLEEIYRVLRDGGSLGLDAIACPPKEKQYYIGKIVNPKADNLLDFPTNSEKVIYREFFTEDTVQFSRGYEIHSETELFKELQDLFQKLHLMPQVSLLLQTI